jgi:transcriptional regulator with XRE-family HTH domain
MPLPKRRRHVHECQFASEDYKLRLGPASLSGLTVYAMDGEPTGRRIKAARTLLNLTVPELAKRLDLPGLGDKTLGSIERGERDLRPQELAPLAAALGVPERFLTHGFESETQTGAKIAEAPPLDPELSALTQTRDALAGILAQIQAQLAEQTEVLNEIRQLLTSDQQVTTETQEATQRLLGAVDVATRELRGDAPRTARGREPRAK